MLLLNHQNFDNLFSFKKNFIRKAKIYIYIVLANARNTYVKYSHYGPIHFKSEEQLNKHNYVN